MAELNSRDRLQPSLLDRLLDDSPQQRQESASDRVLTRQQLRAAVLRDLAWLLNATRAEPEPASDRAEEVAMWATADEARRSLLNFGMPAYSGVTLSSMDRAQVERAVVHAIRTFEPRIDPATLEVQVQSNARESTHNTLQLVIRGKLWSQPVPLELLLAADLDVETGHTRVRELRS
jgi:type VI secretion system protein ImpF